MTLVLRCFHKDHKSGLRHWQLPEPAAAHIHNLKVLFWKTWQSCVYSRTTIKTNLSGLPTDLKAAHTPSVGALFLLFGRRGRVIIWLVIMEERDQEACCEAGCSTPRRLECRIPVAMVPPPPPKRKKPLSLGKKKEKREPSKNGYFQPPDIELFFAMAPRRHACAL